MKILILSRRVTLYSTRRLRNAVRDLGHEAQVIDPLRCILLLEGDVARIEHEGREVRDVGAVIPRIGSYAVEYGISVTRQFRLKGVPCLNDPDAIATAKNKLACQQRLMERRIPMPESALLRFPGHLRRVIQRLGGPPVILKTLRGSQGAGVIKGESVEAVESTLDTLWTMGEDLMIQRYITEAQGRDVRAFVVGGEVIAAMRRTARAGDFRSNIHRGGSGEEATLSPEQQRVALEAAAALGLRVCGVDLLESDHGPLVLEVNASPGFQALEAATGVDCARAIVEELLRCAGAPAPAVAGPASVAPPNLRRD